MSCPDWQALAAWRDDPQAEAPAEWNEALEHFDRGCMACRRAAVAAEPTLVFRRLAAPCALRDRSPEMASVQEASEVEAMRRAVAAMQAASRVETAGRRGRAGWRWQRWAAAAALAVAALSLPGMPSGRSHLSPGTFAAPSAPLLASAALAPEGAEGILPASLEEDLPTVDGVNRPDARIYHMDGEGLSVVMIVDESLDV